MQTTRKNLCEFDPVNFLAINCDPSPQCSSRFFFVDIPFNPIHGGGGGQFDTRFSDISRTFERVNIQFRNFLTFPKYQKQKF